jgi:outer membrane protein assembly factor BamB
MIRWPPPGPTFPRWKSGRATGRSGVGHGCGITRHRIPVIKDDILHVADFSGLFHCLDAKTGELYWTHDLLAACWGSALVVDGKVYIADEDGDVAVFRHSSLREVALPGGQPLAEINIGNSIYGTPIVANNVLYIACKDLLIAIVADEEDRP